MICVTITLMGRPCKEASYQCIAIILKQTHSNNVVFTFIFPYLCYRNHIWGDTYATYRDNGLSHRRRHVFIATDRELRANDQNVLNV